MGKIRLDVSVKSVCLNALYLYDVFSVYARWVQYLLGKPVTVFSLPECPKVVLKNAKSNRDVLRFFFSRFVDNRASLNMTNNNWYHFEVRQNISTAQSNDFGIIRGCTTYDIFIGSSEIAQKYATVGISKKSFDDCKIVITSGSVSRAICNVQTSAKL